MLLGHEGYVPLFCVLRTPLPRELVGERQEAVHHRLPGLDGVLSPALSGAHPTTAFLCLADSIAHGVYLAARELGLAIPADVSVFGYDDQPVSRVLTPPLSTYHWPIDQLTDAVVTRTIRAVDDSKRSRRKVISPTAQIRGSIGPGPGDTPARPFSRE